MTVFDEGTQAVRAGDDKRELNPLGGERPATKNDHRGLERRGQHAPNRATTFTPTETSTTLLASVADLDVLVA